MSDKAVCVSLSLVPRTVHRKGDKRGLHPETVTVIEIDEGEEGDGTIKGRKRNYKKAEGSHCAQRVGQVTNVSDSQLIIASSKIPTLSRDLCEMERPPASGRKRRRLLELGHPVCALCRVLRPEPLAKICSQGHHLHLACVSPWLERSSSCKGCRAKREQVKKDPTVFREQILWICVRCRWQRYSCSCLIRGFSANFFRHYQRILERALAIARETKKQIRMDLKGIGGSCLRGVALRMPEAVRAGASLQLICDYDLEGAPLYSVKFYQGDAEFYRFVPKESPPTRVFPLPGVDAVVDISMSNSTVVTLNNVQRNLTGFYGCEVSADAPLFHTIIKQAPVIVTEEPEALPEVVVEKPKYSLGDRIRANCTSRGGYPPANLTWYVNGKQAKNWADMGTRSEAGLAEIELEAKSILFREGKLRLRCLATQYALYRRSAEVDLQEDTPQLAHVKGPTTPLPPPEPSNSGTRPSAMIWMAVGIILIRWAVPR